MKKELVAPDAGIVIDVEAEWEKHNKNVDDFLEFLVRRGATKNTEALRQAFDDKMDWLINRPLILVNDLERGAGDLDEFIASEFVEAWEAQLWGRRELEVSELGDMLVLTATKVSVYWHKMNGEAKEHCEELYKSLVVAVGSEEELIGVAHKSIVNKNKHNYPEKAYQLSPGETKTEQLVRLKETTRLVKQMRAMRPPDRELSDADLVWIDENLDGVEPKRIPEKLNELLPAFVEYSNT